MSAANFVSNDPEWEKELCQLGENALPLLQARIDAAKSILTSADQSPRHYTVNWEVTPVRVEDKVRVMGKFYLSFTGPMEFSFTHSTMVEVYTAWYSKRILQVSYSTPSGSGNPHQVTCKHVTPEKLAELAFKSFQHISGKGNYF